jgi:hypothetical protein
LLFYLKAMAKELMSTAKELAYKAYRRGILIGDPQYFVDTGDSGEANIRESFENWWSNNYGNSGDTTNFNAEYNVYIDNRRYIQAE